MGLTLEMNLVKIVSSHELNVHRRPGTGSVRSPKRSKSKKQASR